ncbi:MAG: hypothetical protein HY302_02785 [Opitutae bacterium]|nr:hypothetical protein [Opitutae bacterium]
MNARQTLSPRVAALRGIRPLVLLALLLTVSPTLRSAAFAGTEGLVPHAADWRPKHRTVPEIPAFEAAAGKSAVLTLDQVRARFTAAGANWPIVRHRSREFVVLDHGWLRRFLEWQRHFRWKFDHEFQAELLDCDDYSLGMVAFVDLAMLRAGAQSSPALVGRLVVHQAEAWANVGAGALHEVVLVATDRGLFVVEPQDGRMVELENYPNRAHLRWLVLN